MAEPFYILMLNTFSNRLSLPKVPLQFIWLYGMMRIAFELGCFMDSLMSLLSFNGLPDQQILLFNILQLHFGLKFQFYQSKKSLHWMLLLPFLVLFQKCYVFSAGLKIVSSKG